MCVCLAKVGIQGVSALIASSQTRKQAVAVERTHTKLYNCTLTDILKKSAVQIIITNSTNYYQATNLILYDAFLFTTILQLQHTSRVSEKTTSFK